MTTTDLSPKQYFLEAIEKNTKLEEDGITLLLAYYDVDPEEEPLLETICIKHKCSRNVAVATLVETFRKFYYLI